MWLFSALSVKPQNAPPGDAPLYRQLIRTPGAYAYADTQGVCGLRTIAFEKAGLYVTFADPYGVCRAMFWTIEIHNGLLRQYLPKGVIQHDRR